MLKQCYETLGFPNVVTFSDGKSRVSERTSDRAIERVRSYRCGTVRATMPPVGPSENTTLRRTSGSFGGNTRRLTSAFEQLLFLSTCTRISNSEALRLALLLHVKQYNWNSTGQSAREHVDHCGQSPCVGSLHQTSNRRVHTILDDGDDHWQGLDRRVQESMQALDRGCNLVLAHLIGWMVLLGRWCVVDHLHETIRILLTRALVIWQLGVAVRDGGNLVDGFQ